MAGLSRMQSMSYAPSIGVPSIAGTSEAGTFSTLSETRRPDTALDAREHNTLLPKAPVKKKHSATQFFRTFGMNVPQNSNSSPSRYEQPATAFTPHTPKANPRPQVRLATPSASSYGTAPLQQAEDAPPSSPTEMRFLDMINYQRSLGVEHPDMPSLHSGHITMDQLQAGADALFRYRHVPGTQEEGNRYFINGDYIEAAYPGLLQGDSSGVNVPSGEGVILHSHPGQEKQRNPSASDFGQSYYDRVDYGATNLIHLDRYEKTIAFNGTLDSDNKPQFYMAHNPYNFDINQITQTEDGRDRIPIPAPLSRPPSSHSSSGKSRADSIETVDTDEIY